MNALLYCVLTVLINSPSTDAPLGIQMELHGTEIRETETDYLGNFSVDADNKDLIGDYGKVWVEKSKCKLYR